MKIKTGPEIFEIANKDVLSNYEIEESRKSIPSFTAHAMIDSFVEGAKWMQSDLLESSSEGFDEYRKSDRVRRKYPIPIGTQDLFAMIGKEVWQACSLYHAKLVNEKDERIKELKEFWKPTIDKFEIKFPNTGNANTLALTSLTEAFDIHCVNESLKAQLKEKDEQFKNEEECWLITVKEREERIKELENKYQEAMKDTVRILNKFVPSEEVEAITIKYGLGKQEGKK